MSDANQTPDSQGNQQRHEDLLPAAQVPNFTGFEDVHDHSGHDHDHSNHDGDTTEQPHMHGALTADQVHLHLALRDIDEHATTREALPLGAFPAIVVLPSTDEAGHPMVNLDLSGITPGQAHEILTTALNVLTGALEAGALDPHARPAKAAPMPLQPYVASLN